MDDKINVNNYAIKLINDKNFCKLEYRKYIQNDFSFQNIVGIINANVLQKVINKAKRNKRVRLMLSDLLLYADKNSITDENFQLILRFSNRYRTTYLSCLGHLNLSFYQMQILNRCPLSLEAFSWLFDNICHYDIFSDEDMLQILRENSDIKSIAIDHCIDIAQKKYGSSSKIEIAIEWNKKLIKKNKNY